MALSAARWAYGVIAFIFIHVLMVPHVISSNMDVGSFLTKVLMVSACCLHSRGSKGLIQCGALAEKICSTLLVSAGPRAADKGLAW